VAVVRYDNLMRPVVDARPEGFCNLIVERHRRYVLGADVVGEYSAEVIQMVAAVYGRQHADRADRRAAARLSDVH
jgi:pyruvate/2-oxoglutarate dehydrogenase complex dihydrolipoamide dehydrogenase (E3) component